MDGRRRQEAHVVAALTEGREKSRGLENEERLLSG